MSDFVQRSSFVFYCSWPRTYCSCRIPVQPVGSPGIYCRFRTAYQGGSRQCLLHEIFLLDYRAPFFRLTLLTEILEKNSIQFLWGSVVSPYRVDRTGRILRHHEGGHESSGDTHDSVRDLVDSEVRLVARGPHYQQALLARRRDRQRHPRIPQRQTPLHAQGNEGAGGLGLEESKVWKV